MGRVLFLFSLLFLVFPLRANAGSMIRIAVAENQRTLEVRAEGLRVRPLHDGGFYTAAEGGVLRLGLVDGRISIQGIDSGADAAKLRADGPLAVAGKEVRGSVEVLVHGGGLLVVNELPMETYLAAVLGSEMPPAFEPEALKAQAVAARTYAIGKKIAAEGQPFHLGATVLSQVYGGVHREDPRTRAAVEATEGEVLVFEHSPIEAYFFSSCGGRTAGGAEALGRPLPYLKSHSCPESAQTPGARWSLSLSPAELGKRLGLAPVSAVRIDTHTTDGRARTVEVQIASGKRRFTAVELRRRLGYGELKSLAFDVTKTGGSFRFTGKGNGHGAGMCQWGAQAAAKEGWDYRRILGHYYEGAELRRMW